MDSKALGLLGLCARAGKVLSGEPAAEQAVKKKNAYLVLIDEAASENAKKALSDACAYYGAPLRTLPAGCAWAGDRQSPAAWRRPLPTRRLQNA